jgi:bisphosphoglycerate-independent phosphoglycerate mutase (AlkP superfamily)
MQTLNEKAPISLAAGIGARVPTLERKERMNANTTAVRQLAFDIEETSGDIKILVSHIFEKIDNVGHITGEALESVKAINCFATCLLKLIGDVTSSNERILKLTCEVPA